ncbi:MAG TPA: hypothetical protein VH702_20095 [Vicinamibacterales bacterium]
MTAYAIAFITFACTFGFALLGAYIRDRLPPPHLSKESQDVVRLGMGLVATMTALLLGLVTAAARGTFDAQDSAIRTSAANILTLDRHLARFGPETASTRDLLRRAVAARLESIWTNAQPLLDSASAPQTSPPVEEIENQILDLSPATEAQRWSKTEALRLSEDVVKARWRVLSAGRAVPPAFLAVVIFWLTVTFASFGLYAPRNATVVSVLFIAAVSVAAAVFLILELDDPLEGVIKVSSAPLRFTLDNLGH